MIYEILENVKFDVAKLTTHLHNHVLTLPPVMQSQHFGGWSVLSSDGSYLDGWHQAHKCYREEQGKTIFDLDKAAQIGLKKTVEYRHPTEICTGYLLEVIEQIRALGLHPSRARISVLRPRSKSSYHRDGQPDEYAVRLHIPIVTNEQCIFHCEQGDAHLPADGSAYFLRVNRMHQVFNHSDFDRYHLIMNVYDLNGVSKHHVLHRKKD